MDAELQARYELAQAEDVYLAAKERRGEDEEAYQEAKAEFSELRRQFREERQAQQAAINDGDAVASPRALEAKVEKE